MHFHLIKPWSPLGFNHYIPWPHTSLMTPSSKKQSPFYLYFLFKKKTCIHHGRDVTRASHTSRLSPGLYAVIKTMPRMWIQIIVCVFFIPMGSRGLKQWVVTSISHMGEMRDSDWSRPNLLRSDWLPIIGAIMTTHDCQPKINCTD